MPDNEFEHPIFHEGADQLTMVTAILDSFPGQRGNPDVVVPIHPQVREDWAKEVIARGVVIVPSLMQKLPVPTGDHPEAGWLQPVVWMNRADYQAFRAAQAESASAAPAEQVGVTSQQEAQMKDALRAIKPSLLNQIESMSDPDARAAMAARLAPDIPRHFDAVNAAIEQIEHAKEDGNG